MWASTKYFIPKFHLNIVRMVDVKCQQMENYTRLPSDSMRLLFVNTKLLWWKSMTMDVSVRVDFSAFFHDERHAITISGQQIDVIIQLAQHLSKVEKCSRE